MSLKKLMPLVALLMPMGASADLSSMVDDFYYEESRWNLPKPYHLGKTYEDGNIIELKKNLREQYSLALSHLAKSSKQPDLLDDQVR